MANRSRLADLPNPAQAITINKCLNSAGRGSEAARTAVEWAILRLVYLNSDLRQGVGELPGNGVRAMDSVADIDTFRAVDVSRWSLPS